MRRLALAIGLLGGVAWADNADKRYAEEPTNGISLPAAPIAGEHDARAVTLNPGGLPLLRGPELALAGDIEDDDVATSAGPGFGAFLATSFGGGVLPRMGVGMAFEWLRPPRTQLEPDPGEPFRFTLSYGLGLGKNAGFGFAWHHFHAEGALDGKDTFDLGLSTRWGNHLAIGAALRDVATNPIGDTPVQRRYELEAVLRPLGTSQLEVALGGRIGETRRDVDGWARVSVRVARGVTVLAQVTTDELHALTDTPTGLMDDGGRDVRATIGLDLSFGSLSIAGFANGLRDDSGNNHALGGSFLVRAQAVGEKSVVGTGDHIERVELSGSLDIRALTSIVMRLRSIARDPTAIAVVVTFDDVSGGWAALEEVRDALAAVKRAHKKIYAYMVSGTNRDYYVATIADKIYIDPGGGLRLVGLAGTMMYFRGALDMLGVLPQFEKVQEFKSAPEQFTETGPTPTAAKMHDEMFDSLWTQWRDTVASARHLTPERVQAIVDAGPYTSGDLAGKTELADAVAPPDKVSELVLTDLGRLVPVGAPAHARPEQWHYPRVAIVYIDGDITDGQSHGVQLFGQKLAGGETLVKTLEALRADSSIGAVILRIDSPGGSALASELIAREVFALRHVKPILCSMSNVAASGGYFVAAGCDAIYAEPMTITGSIGIFYGKFDVGGLAAKLGVTFDTYKRGAHADAESLYRPWTDEERATLREKLHYMYGRFVGAVAEGRGLSKMQVDAVGRGHVWTGAQAKSVKLVDQFGGLSDVLDETIRRMGLPAGSRVELVELPAPPSSLVGTALHFLGVEAPTAPLGITDLPAVRELLHTLPVSVLVAPDAAQARLPFGISWE
ncbi:MAG TPA: signal peptide peptidase SppA [Kofleriaceae bacterium]|jgi:protease-4